MKLNSIILFGCVLISSAATAQVADGSFGYYNDALLFSKTNPLYGSTARIQGVGGAQVSLGGDLSVAGVNPAGLGFFTKSVTSFTPSMNFHNANANYLGYEVSTFKNNFNFANLGVALNANKGDYTSEKFKGGTFAITLSKVNDFNSETTYQGQNTSNSIIDSFLERAGTLETDQLDDQTYAAYENYLINPVFDDNENIVGYDAFIVGNPRQTETIETSGSQYQWNFSYGGNYDDKIYFGGGLGISSVDYSIKKIYREDNYLNAGVPDELINYTEFRDKLQIEGTGINATFGMIVRPLPVFTLGVAYTSPTFYALSDRSSFTTFTRWNSVQLDNGEVLNDRTYNSNTFISDYDLRVPGKLSVGATAFLGKIGFISGDLEFVDFADAQLKSSDFQVFADNQTITNLYSSVVNYRLGGEIRWEEFRFRGGYSFQADPNEANDYDASRSNITYGVGYRTKDYYVDLGVINSSALSRYSPYTFTDGSGPVANIEGRTTTASVTVGFNF